MQTLRKKTSPLKYKNETSRFLGEGVSFKAKLIGILEVSEARGDRMCQEALSDLKTAIRAAGEHKQRITINIAIDGLRLRDEKTGDSLYHHPVHKISFIAQDMTDSRAFGYIFGSPDTGHRFFGIKTDKAASQVVIAMRDLFQVVFALKKKEIELAKQHLDKNRYGTSPLFSSETSISSSKSHSAPLDSNKTSGGAETKTSLSTAERPTPAVADLVDLELELNSLQQGLNQMERITPSDPFGSKDDPFGDSFTPFPKPILPPPPSSGKDRASRSSESGSLFSPKTPHTTEADPSKELNYSNEFAASHPEEPGSGDWFTPSTSLFEDPPLVPEPVQDQHEVTKKEILSQFDVFTDLDPLGTGKFKPYVDKEHFFQELKNPPKKVLNDLVLESQPQESLTFPTNFETKNHQNNLSTSPNLFPSDPFGEDPFVKTDPFAEADFTKQDPFETDGIFNNNRDAAARNDFSEQFKFPVKAADLQTIFNRAKSPKASVLGTSPRSLQFAKQNTFDVQFDSDKKLFGVMQLHENPSLDLSSESECAPEPPPRPTNNLAAQIKPPPLPPKKQPGEICVKPPPRPPHVEDVHYDFMDNYETAPNSLEYARNLEKSPPLPVPARKSKFESDFLPERPKKQFNVSADDEEDYLTPVSFPKSKAEWQESKVAGQILLPPPQKVNRKSTSPNLSQVTVASYLESKPNITTSMSTDKNSLDGLNITLSQLTLSGLNQLATKLNIPASQLSNMTLVQLTNYLSNFIKSSAAKDMQTETDAEEGPPFQADFANFNNFNNKTTSETYDRYAVFRELLQEEIKQTKIDSEPQEIAEEKENVQQKQQKINNNINEEGGVVLIDKYAALRDIVEIEVTTQDEKDKSIEENDKNEEEEEEEEEEDEEEDTTNLKNLDEQIENEANIINTEKFIDKDKSRQDNNKVIEYDVPVKSPVNKMVKSPVPVAVTEIVQQQQQNNARLTSGSLSDAISGSSPEIDNNNTGSASEVPKKDNAGESWAIFDQPNKDEKQHVQSEEGVSPWSSDSKEFGNGSPPDWRPRVDSGSGEEQWSRRRREQEGWWDTSAEPEVQYYPPNRRSTDSYEDECYACYERPRRRRQQQGHWASHVGGQQGTQGGGGHSSSSRDVSPWEEEPSRRRDHKQMWSSRHGRQQLSFERQQHKDRRHTTDSWDEEDDFEYEEEHSSRFHWHGNREPEREERWGGGDDWGGDDRKHRRRRGIEVDRDRWCCPDWEQSEIDKHPSRYSSGRWSDVPPVKWRDRKHDDRFYSRDSQDSPWEDEYPNEPPEETHIPHYLTARRNWKRPSSASEMERKSGEMKQPPRQYNLGTGGSDGERDRRYKSNRRSKSRESQFDAPRHKPDPGLTLRATRPKHHHVKGGQQQQHFEGDFMQQDLSSTKKLESTKLELSNKKSSTVSSSRKKSKDNSPKGEDSSVNTFPRKSAAQSLFENDFVVLETESPNSATCINQSFTFENDFETSEAESPTINSKAKNIRHKIYLSKGLTKSYDSDARVVKASLKSARYQAKQKSLFEDDFSPTDKLETQEPHATQGISSIKEEVNVNENENENEEENTFDTNNFAQKNGGSRKKILMKNRLSNNLRPDANNLKKSESVNIFAREDDPFDDDFFSGKDTAGGNVTLVCREKKRISPKTTELKWTEQFEDFDTRERK